MRRRAGLPNGSRNPSHSSPSCPAHIPLPHFLPNPRRMEGRRVNFFFFFFFFDSVAKTKVLPRTDRKKSRHAHAADHPSTL